MSNETLREQAEREDEFREYKEPLSRIFKEVQKALPYWIEEAKQNEVPKKEITNYLLGALLIGDVEVKAEIENLLSKMIDEIKGEQQ